MASEPAPGKSAQWHPAIVWAVRLAIIALALRNFYQLLDHREWLSRMLSDGYSLTVLIWNNIFLFIINPLSLLAAMILAAMGKRLILAGLLAAMPQFQIAGSLAIFTLGVFIYGYGP